MKLVYPCVAAVLCFLTASPSVCAQTRSANDSLEIRWIRAHRRPIASLVSSQFSDLSFLQPLLAGKRIVQLGESTHGATEFNQIKVRLVRFLHEQLGYNVIAFESDAFGCFEADRAMPGVSPDAAMRQCLTAVWWTSDLLELMRYAGTTHTTRRPLHVAGFDIQFGPVNMGRSAILASVVATIDTAYGRRVYALDSSFLAMRRRAGTHRQYGAVLATEGPRIIQSYDSLADFLELHRAALDSAMHRSHPGAVWLTRAVAHSVPAFVRHQTLSEGGERFAARDAGMAWNVEQIVEHLYPDDKVIVWAHNDHVRHDHAAVRPESGPPLGPGMGTRLRERYGSGLYTIGLYMLNGASDWMDTPGEVVPVAAPSPGSMEALLVKAGGGDFFVDLSLPMKSPGTDWMYAPIAAKWWGKEDETLILRDQYDAILVIDTVTPSKLLLNR